MSAMEKDKHLREEPVARTELLKGHFLHVVRDTVRLPSGAESTREYVLHPGAVMVIALLEDGRVVMERQYRHPMRDVMVEFPAGKRDAGESSLQCAKRELLEETGYSARDWAFAGRLAPTIAYSDEIIDIWFARGLTLGERQLDAGEFLDVFAATPSEHI
jgi:ADP-ribose pyrophosphatase